MAKSCSGAVALLAVIFVTSCLAMSAGASECSKTPIKFEVYAHATVGDNMEATVRTITNSPLGKLDVFGESLTIKESPNSQNVGTVYGTISSLTGGPGSEARFFSYGYYIKGTVSLEGSTTDKEIEGTIVSQGPIPRGQPGVTPILGGTGDFLGAKGFIKGTRVSGEGPNASYKQEITVWCKVPKSSIDTY